MGIEATLDGGELGSVERAWAGNLRLMTREGASLSPAQDAALRELNAEGSSSVIVGVGARVLAVMGVSDTLRPGIAEAISSLRAAGVAHQVMLTGDKMEVAQAVAAQIGLTEYRAELLPEDKLRIMGELPGPLAMVGDGVNDAPALARADLGIAVASGTDVAIESADVVLMKNDLGKLAGAVKLAKDARRTVFMNLAFAFRGDPADCAAGSGQAYPAAAGRDRARGRHRVRGVHGAAAAGAPAVDQTRYTDSVCFV